MSDAEQLSPVVDPEVVPAAAAAVADTGNNLRHVKLSNFWPQAPQLWFSQTECRFAAHGVTSEFTRYCLVVGALPHDTLRRVADIVETPPPANPYTVIKQRLLGAHQMTDYQRAKRLYLLPPIGNRKPSEMMAVMLEIMCPRGKEKTNLFVFLFLQSLPREIRVLLSRVDHKDPKLMLCGPCMGGRQRWPLFRRRWTFQHSLKTVLWPL
jgi:hypothetical protein